MLFTESASLVALIKMAEVGCHVITMVEMASMLSERKERAT